MKKNNNWGGFREGSGRPKATRNKNKKMFYLTEKNVQNLIIVAKNRKYSQSSLIELLINIYLVKFHKYWQRGFNEFETEILAKRSEVFSDILSSSEIERIRRALKETIKQNVEYEGTRKGKKCKKMFMLSEETVQTLDRIAEDTGCSQSCLIDIVLFDELKKINDKLYRIESGQREIERIIG